MSSARFDGRERGLWLRKGEEGKGRREERPSGGTFLPTGRGLRLEFGARSGWFVKAGAQTGQQLPGPAKVGERMKGKQPHTQSQLQALLQLCRFNAIWECVLVSAVLTNLFAPGQSFLLFRYQPNGR